MPTVYGDGSLYGAATSLYGRISSGLAAAQQAFSRETGLKVNITDERVNLWEDFVADTSGQSAASYSSTSVTDPPWTQRYFSYRGMVDVCVLNNGDIVRVRCDIDDRQIYIQTITDPTNAAQWASWTLLYSGTHYGLAIAPTAAGSYKVYTSKSDGLYINNSKVWDQTDILAIGCHRAVDGRQMPDVLWIYVTQLGIHVPGHQLRKINVYFTDDATTVAPYEVEWNWVWQRSSAASIDLPSGKAAKVSSFPAYANPELINTGESILSTIHNDYFDLYSFRYPRLIRGFPGAWGHTTISGSRIVLLSDGYYYLFYAENHVDEEWQITSSLSSIVWQRSKDCEVWSEPVFTGFNSRGFGGVIESGGYIYLCGYREVHRRVNTPVVYELSNYVPQVSWESPRENQTGSGELTIANPDGVNDALQDLSDRKLIIQPGIKVIDGSYEYANFDDFWVKRITKSVDGKANRLKCEFGNIWSRLENPLRDTLNFVGRTDYHDFQPGGTNEPFNYYFVDSTGEKSGNNLSVAAGGTVIWTGWRGYNPYFHANISATPCSIIFRWIDADNYLRLTYTGSRIQIDEVVAGVVTNLKDDPLVGVTVTSLGIRCRWRRLDVYVNRSIIESLFATAYLAPAVYKPGYVGFQATGAYTVSYFDFQDEEFDYTSKDLIRFALALGDYHNPVIGSALAKQFALIWGPQTDLPTAADALRQLLEAEKLELVWKDGFIQVGKFTDTTIIRTLEDEVVETSESDEGNRRINVAVVDGNDYSWIEIDGSDIKERGRAIQAYYDLPELLSDDDVVARAQEEIRRGKLGHSPGGKIPLIFDLWRMDPITWIDNAGNSKNVRIEGIKIDIDQSKQPSQREELDTSLL